MTKKVRRKLTLGQEDLVRDLGVSNATINRWENCQAKPFRLSGAQYDNFYANMITQGKLKLPGGDK